MYKEELATQCNTWLSNSAHGFHRDSTDYNRMRPLAQVFYCNFSRVMENKEKKVDENTINYYKPNTVIPNIMISVEVIYSLLCMALYLLIIYWNAVGRNDVLVGKYDGFESDEDIVN